ncbi:MAG TPA: hypothetical protein VFV30_13125 [Novosphingobium sp.]|nr:hypothetical protein [Novosphingobium sp.]
MSDSNEAEAKPRKKKGKGFLIKGLIGLILIAAGGGGTFALVQAGMLGDHAEEKKEADHPKLVKKGEEDPYAPKTEAKEGEGPPKSRARAAANTAPAITTSPRTLPRTSGIRARSSRSAWPVRPGAMAGC